jgi:hypothetical protein
MSGTITAYLTDSDIEFLRSSFKIHYCFRKDNFRQLTYKYGMGYYQKRDTNIDNILCRLIELINTIVKTPNKKSHWGFTILIKDINKIHSILENQDTSDSLSVFNKIQNIMLSNMRHTLKINK